MHSRSPEKAHKVGTSEFKKSKSRSEWQIARWPFLERIITSDRAGPLQKQQAQEQWNALVNASLYGVPHKRTIDEGYPSTNKNRRIMGTAKDTPVGLTFGTHAGYKLAHKVPT